MRRFWFAPVLGALILFVTTAGCGGSGPKKIEISGTVKFAGQLVSEGDITVIPDDKSVGAEGGKIKDGKYTMRVPQGKSTVKITASRTVPGKKGPMGEDFVEQYIPAKYNDKSELTIEVDSGKTTHDFDLKH